MDEESADIAHDVSAFFDEMKLCKIPIIEGSVSLVRKLTGVLPLCIVSGSTRSQITQGNLINNPDDFRGQFVKKYKADSLFVSCILNMDSDGIAYILGNYFSDENCSR